MTDILLGPDDANANVPDLPVLKHNQWPTQANCRAFYGNPALGNWLHNNTVSVTCPWTLNMGGVKLNHILINKKCADSLHRVLNYIWVKCDQSQAEIEKLHYHLYSGSYNFRPIRGSVHTLSMHSYAAAIDWDDQENQQHSMHHLFTDESLLVKAFKAEGWVWGGDWSRASIDAMHVQAARVN